METFHQGWPLNEPLNENWKLFHWNQKHFSHKCILRKLLRVRYFLRTLYKVYFAVSIMPLQLLCKFMKLYRIARLTEYSICVEWIFKTYLCDIFWKISVDNKVLMTKTDFLSFFFFVLFTEIYESENFFLVEENIRGRFGKFFLIKLNIRGCFEKFSLLTGNIRGWSEKYFLIK